MTDPQRWKKGENIIMKIEESKNKIEYRQPSGK